VLLRSDMWSYGKAKNMTVEHNSQTDSNAEWMSKVTCP
jgi:hypothetical protein